MKEEPKNAFSFGYHFANGVHAYIGVILIIVTALMWLISLVFKAPLDATDLSDNERSGFTLKIDYGTGCQYLKSGSELIPRIGPDGLPVCLRSKPNV